MSRLQQRAQQDPSSSIELRRLSRKLQAVHEELDDYTQKINIFLKAPESDWEALVLKHQTSLTSEFFYHVGRLVQASSEDARRKESESPLLPCSACALPVTIQEHDSTHCSVFG